MAAEGIALSIVGKLAEYAVRPILRQIQYLFCYNSNIKNLGNKVQSLENKRYDVNQVVVAGERNVEEPNKEVSEWLRKVNDFMKEAGEISKDEAGSETRCLFTRGPNLKCRYTSSRKARKMAIEADDLLKDECCKLHNLCHRPLPMQESKPIKEEIKEALKDEEISIIGICGMHGAGNTALAKEIVDEVKNEKLFDQVAFAFVSENPDINKIQDQLAQMLCLTIREKANKAERLRRRLQSNNGKSVLVILDDVWKEIDLETIGIPSPRGREGLKIMFTTRIEDISRKMGAHTFKNNVLGENGDRRLKGTSTKDKIKEALKDKEIRIIGICGMPGVGKTTMANELIKAVQGEKLFDKVAFAVVSKDPDVEKIQDQLAEVLGLKIEEKANKDVRAKRLCQGLESRVNKTVLVILDDVWKEFDLETIGIPSPDGRKGLKIMFTTRIKDTCSAMKAQKKFEIEVLGEKEGWKLFKYMAGISDDETNVELVSLAKKVANECGGLPLALVVIGKALRNKDAAHKWRDALQQLQKSHVTNLKGMLDLVYSRIEWSYNYLEHNEDRELLLLCSLFDEDESIPIEDLVRYARGLELFPNTETLDETRDRVYSIVDNLKSCYLLQSGEEEDEVKLHDVIRDFCLQIATKDKCGYLVKHAAGLKEWPEFDNDESCSAVSITFDKLDQLHGGLKYRNMKLLRVICRDLGELKSSEEFFEDIKELRVLELEGMNIQIPSAIQLLTGLRTLCLISCELDSQLSVIGSLKKLEILRFYDSYFGASVCKELANLRNLNLSNLKSIDLRFRKPYPLVPGVLSGMKKLEELYLGNYNYSPIEDEDQRYIIEELSSLTSLRDFQISTYDIQILKQILRALSLKNLENFQIIRAARPRFSSTEDDRVTRSLCLYGKDEENLPSFLQPEINSLMKRTYHLQIEKFKVLKNVVSELDGDGFINLKTLELSFCDNLEYLIDATNSIPSCTFGKLESLDLTC